MPGVFVKIIEDKFWGQWTDKKKSCHIYMEATITFLNARQSSESPILTLLEAL